MAESFKIHRYTYIHKIKIKSDGKPKVHRTGKYNEFTRFSGRPFFLKQF